MVTPTLRQLDIFAQMIASGSIAECARDLDMKQHEIAAEIDALENRLGHKLFDLQGGIATLTDAGHKTIEAMQLLTATPEDQWDSTHAPPKEVPDLSVIKADPEAEQKAQEPQLSSQSTTGFPEPLPSVPDPRIETITLAAHPAIFGHFQDALSAFEQTNGDVAITLDLDVHSATQAISRLAAGRADIAYFYTLDAPEGWPSRYAWSEQISLYIGEGHPLAALDIVMQDDLGQVAPAALSSGNSQRILLDEALANAGIAAMVPTVETDNPHDIMMAVRDGDGYFATFGPLARDFGRMKGIRRVPLGFPLPAIEVRQALRNGIEDNSVAATLSEYLFR